MKFKEVAAYMRRENAKWPATLVRMPEEDWPPTARQGARPPVEIWRSRDFLVQVYGVPGFENIERISVNRTSLERSGRWSENVTWDELQELKRQCGRGDCDAVEVFPRDSDVVNVANMRHLWVLKVGLVAWAWRARPTEEAPVSKTQQRRLDVQKGRVDV